MSWWGIPLTSHRNREARPDVEILLRVRHYLFGVSSIVLRCGSCVKLPLRDFTYTLEVNLRKSTAVGTRDEEGNLYLHPPGVFAIVDPLTRCTFF